MLIKCDSSGNIQWSKKLSSSSLKFENTFSIAFQSKTGDYYFCAGDYSSNMQLIKLNKKGNFVWNRTFTEPGLYLGFGLDQITELENTGLISFIIPACEGYCVNSHFIKFDTSGNLHGYKLILSSPYENPYSRAIWGSDDKPKAVFTIEDKKAATNNYAYLSLNFDQYKAKCILIPYNIFSLQSFARKHQLEKILNKPLEDAFSTLLLSNDWSMTNVLAISDDIHVNKYDSLGRICPDYTLPETNTNTKSVEFDLYPFSPILLFNTITITDTIIKEQKVNIDSVICSDSAINVNTYSFDYVKNQEDKPAQLNPNPASNFVTINYKSEKNH